MVSTKTSQSTGYLLVYYVHEIMQNLLENMQLLVLGSLSNLDISHLAQLIPKLFTINYRLLRNFDNVGSRQRHD